MSSIKYTKEELELLEDLLSRECFSTGESLTALEKAIFDLREDSRLLLKMHRQVKAELGE